MPIPTANGGLGKKMAILEVSVNLGGNAPIAEVNRGRVPILKAYFGVGDNMVMSVAKADQGGVAASPRADGSLGGSVEFLKVWRRGDQGFVGAVGSIWRAEHAARKRQGRVSSAAGQDRRLPMSLDQVIPSQCVT